MKLFAPLPVLAVLCSLAASAPAPVPEPYNYCPYANFNYCDVDSNYIVCVNGGPTFFTCTGGCQETCVENQPCTPRCDNGQPTSPPV